MRIKSDADGKVRIGLLEIEKGRQAEVDGERRLLKAILGYEPVIRHNEDGKPLIDDSHISISHTIGYVAVILSHDHEVGIDVEYVSDRVKRIAGRFLRKDESFTSQEQLLTAWCAKETMYKLFSSEHLGYQEVKIDPISGKMTNLKHNITIDFRREVTPAYVLTYAWY